MMNSEAKNPAPGIPPMELPDDLEPVYSNMARISHTPSELTVDFARMLPGQKQMKVLARMLLSPVGAKLLLRALAENIARYEAAFGEIRLPGEARDRRPLAPGAKRVVQRDRVGAPTGDDPDHRRRSRGHAEPGVDRRGRGGLRHPR